MLQIDPIEQCRTRLLDERYIEGVGFVQQPRGQYRSDAACWAILALRMAGVESPVLQRARRALADSQFEDGRVCISPQHPNACWPTALAVLAWDGTSEFDHPKDRAIRFLLGFQHARDPEASVTTGGHESTIPGWPWIAGTYAWVEPTVYALLALRACGYAEHRRTWDAVRLLMNRQLPISGWNSGSTITLGQEMRPTPENTGQSLQALASLVPRPAVEKSIRYLRLRLASLDTPISLAWAVLSLHAWQETPDQWQEKILAVLARQKEVGSYDTVSLSLLLLAWYCPAGLVRPFGFPIRRLSMSHPQCPVRSGTITRRKLLMDGLAAGALGVAPALVRGNLRGRRWMATVFIAKASSYDGDLVSTLMAGFRHLGIAKDIRGKRILLKPNFVETRRGTNHICTRPEVICAAVEAFRRFGAAEVLIGEGPGHCRDTARILEEAEMAQPLVEHKIPFVDLNNDNLIVRPNTGGTSGLPTLTLPATVQRVDWIVSMPKMKTHHWVGATLSMKNLFGLMPGIAYGWPKNVFHWTGIKPCIFDINATVRPHFAIIDGIVGMEGDGPIMGTPKPAGVLVMGRDLAAVDATAARIMGIDPLKIAYLEAADGRLGTIQEEDILQRGERIAAVRTDFALHDFIPAHRGLRLPRP